MFISEISLDDDFLSLTKKKKKKKKAFDLSELEETLPVREVVTFRGTHGLKSNRVNRPFWQIHLAN